MFTSSSTTGNQWYLNGAEIPGATQPTFTASNSGTYQVTFTDPVTGCSSELSNGIYFLMTGIEPNGNAASVAVFPNPFREELTVSYELSSAGAATITLSDSYGKTLRTALNGQVQTAGKHEVRIPAGTLPNGIYLIRVQTETYTVIRKAILNK